MGSCGRCACLVCGLIFDWVACSLGGGGLTVLWSLALWVRAGLVVCGRLFGARGPARPVRRTPPHSSALAGFRLLVLKQHPMRLGAQSESPPLERRARRF